MAGYSLPWEQGSQESLMQQTRDFGDRVVQGNLDAAKRGQVTYSVAGTFNKLASQTPEAQAARQAEVAKQNNQQPPAVNSDTQPVKQVSPNDLAPPPAVQVDQARQTGTVVDHQITKVSQQVANRSTGVGDPQTGNIVAPPTPPKAQQATKQMSLEGERLAFDTDHVPNWHDSNAFSAGLINFGVSLLAGNDILTSMQGATSKFDELYGQEKREIWAEDLRKKGYDENEIQSWIQTGNNKELTDPMEKKMKIVQYNQALSNLDKSNYENSPEMRNYRNSHQMWEDQMAVQKYKDEQAYKTAELGIQRAHLALAKQQAAAKNGAGANPFGLDNRTLSRVNQVVKPMYDKVMNRTTQFNAADNFINEALRLRQQGGSEQQVSQLYNNAKEAYARAMKGTFTGGITPNEVEQYAGNPNQLKGIFSKAKVAMGGDIPTDELQRMKAAASGAREQEQVTWNQFAGNQYDNLAREIGPERAGQVMSLWGMTSGEAGGWNAATGQNRGTANARTVTIKR